MGGARLLLLPLLLVLNGIGKTSQILKLNTETRKTLVFQPAPNPSCYFVREKHQLPPGCAGVDSHGLWCGFLGVLCAETGVGLDDPCGSLPTQGIPQFHSVILHQNGMICRNAGAG